MKKTFWLKVQALCNTYGLYGSIAALGITLVVLLRWWAALILVLPLVYVGLFVMYKVSFTTEYVRVYAPWNRRTVYGMDMKYEYKNKAHYFCASSNETRIVLPERFFDNPHSLSKYITSWVDAQSKRRGE